MGTTTFTMRVVAFFCYEFITLARTLYYSLHHEKRKRMEGHIGVKYWNGINGNKGTWSGYSIDHYMSEKTIYKTIVAIADHELREYQNHKSKS